MKLSQFVEKICNAFLFILSYKPRKFPHLMGLRNVMLFIIIINILIFFHHLSLAKSKSIDFQSPNEIPVFIITLKGHDHRVETVTNLFQTYANMKPEPFYGVNGHELFENLKYIEGKYATLKYSSTKNKPLVIGERGLRETMRKVFTMAYKRNYDHVIVLEDDSIPHLNFTSLFRDLHSRCRQADVLLLGATIWHTSPEFWPRGVCFDADARTFGAFALLVKRSAFVPILSWLETDRRVPFDHMYIDLQNRGIVVRVAHPPFLVIADITHNSSINNNRGRAQFDTELRARKHDWRLENYPLFSIPE